MLLTAFALPFAFLAANQKAKPPHAESEQLAP
jgi:hypothetical protein